MFQWVLTAVRILWIRYKDNLGGTSPMKVLQKMSFLLDPMVLNWIYYIGLLFFVTTDKFSPLTTMFSITTIYTSVILLIGSLIRSLFSGEVWLLTFTDMVKPDDILLMCEAITVARSQKDFVKYLCEIDW